MQEKIKASITSPLPDTESAFAWAQEAARNDNWSESAKRWAILRKAYPTHPLVWFDAINAHISANEDEKAEALLIEAAACFPDHPNLLLQPARLAMKHGAQDKAADLLKQARQKHPNNPAVWLHSADCAIQKGHFAQAVEYNTQAKKLSPDSSAPYKQYAELAMAQHNWEEALNRWEKFRKQFPNDPAGYMRAAKSAESMGNLKLARKLKLANEYGDEILTATDESRVTTEPPNKKHRHATINGLVELIWTKAVFNLRSETQRNYLSYLWWIIEPLLHIAVYFLVFGLLIQRGGEGFIPFLLTGLLPWMWFSKTLSTSSTSITAGQGLILQIGVPPIVFPLISILQSSLKQIPTFLLFLAFMWISGYSPNIHWYGLLPVIFVQTLFIIMFSCLLAAMIPFIRDFTHIVPTGLSLLMFLSGIFYNVNDIPMKWQDIFLMNPVAFLLHCYREIMIYEKTPDFTVLGYWGAFAVTGCLLTLLAYRKLRYVIPRVIQA